MDVEINNFYPVRRVPAVIVSGDQGSVFIHCIEAEEEHQQVGGGGAGAGAVIGGDMVGGGRPAGGMNAQLMAVH